MEYMTPTRKTHCTPAVANISRKFTICSKVNNTSVNEGKGGLQGYSPPPICLLT